jgi:hypothetical protein
MRVLIPDEFMAVSAAALATQLAAVLVDQNNDAVFYREMSAFDLAARAGLARLPDCDQTCSIIRRFLCSDIESGILFQPHAELS